LAVALVVATFLHLEPIGISKPSAILLVITGSFYAVIIGMRMGVLILQKADATIHQGDGLLKVELELRRPLKVCAGQQIWLRIPYTSYTAFAESHPFVVSSWEKAENGMAKKIILLIEPKKGFTGRLKILATSEFIDPPRFTALIEGPYGRPTRAEDFGTVILYATGIGIAAQLAVVKQLLESRESGHAKTQRITLLWEVEKELVYQDEKGKLKYDTASQMVIDLLNQDYLRLKNSMNQDWLDFIAKLTPEEAKEALKFKSVWKGADPDQGYVRLSHRLSYVISMLTVMTKRCFDAPSILKIVLLPNRPFRNMATQHA
jgi:predicted ferric reductase